MPRWRRTWRDADGVRVEGTWRHIFTRNAGMYYLNDLVIYADGAVECRIGGLTNLDGLREAFQRGTVATTLEEGEYFRNRDIADAEWEARVPADGPETAQAATLTLYQTVYPKGWPADPGVKVLQNDLPATISVEGREYPSVTHAYRALSTSDSDRHDRIAAAARAYDAAKVAEQAPRRANWAAARLAVMAKLLRAKYTQHPQLAQTLLATADAHIIYTGLDSAYWIAPRHQLDRPPARSDPLRTVRRRHAPRPITATLRLPGEPKCPHVRIGSLYTWVPVENTWVRRNSSSFATSTGRARLRRGSTWSNLVMESER